MDDVVYLVVVEYGGLLKVEYGIGCNMVLFVELEWGEDVYCLMWQFKCLFDLCGIFNLGVVFSDDLQSYLKNFKLLLVVDEIVDKCIECGFCELVCLLCGLIFMLCQCIVLWCDIQVKKCVGVDIMVLECDYCYQGIDICVVIGLCVQCCFVNINIGELICKLCGVDVCYVEGVIWLVCNFVGVMCVVCFVLFVVDGVWCLFGVFLLVRVSCGFSQVSGGCVL